MKEMKQNVVSTGLMEKRFSADRCANDDFEQECATEHRTWPFMDKSGTPRFPIIPKGYGNMNEELFYPEITQVLEVNSEKRRDKPAAVVRRQVSISSEITTIDTRTPNLR